MPRKAAEPRFVRLTLEWCNRQRKKKDKKPLKHLPLGYMNDVKSCPCGSATGLYVYEEEAYVRSEDVGLIMSDGIKLPESVKEFVEEFDKGNLPQYIKSDGM